MNCQLCGKREDERAIQEQGEFSLCLSCADVYTDDELVDQITKKQKLLHKSLQDGVLDIDAVENFFEEYDHHGSIGWLQEILNGNIDLDLMRQAIWCHSVDNKAECQQLVDDMFIVKWWEKEENQNEAK